jgi:hypothetical protein
VLTCGLCSVMLSQPFFLATGNCQSANQRKAFIPSFEFSFEFLSDIKGSYRKTLNE